MISRKSFGGAFRLVRLGEAVEFLDSRRRPVIESERSFGHYPYYGANGQQGSIDDYIFDEPLVLLAEDGGHFGEPERGIAYRISGKTWVNNHAHVLRPSAGVDIGFLCRVLENYDVTPFVTGTTRGKLTQAGASEIMIPLPSLPEQQRIAEVLDRAEALRAKRRFALAQLDSLTQAIFLDMFGDLVQNERDWETAQVSEICELVRGSSPRPQGDPLFFGGPVPRLMVADITRDGWLVTPRIDSLTVEGAKRSRPVSIGTVVMAVSGNVGLVSRLAVDACVHDGFVAFTHLEVFRCQPEFLLAFLHFSKPLHEKHKAGAIFINLTTTDIKAMQIPLPPVGLQHDFARRVAAVEKLKAAHRASLEKMDELFACLQHGAFLGEL